MAFYEEYNEVYDYKRASKFYQGIDPSLCVTQVPSRFILCYYDVCLIINDYDNFYTCIIQTKKNEYIHFVTKPNMYINEMFFRYKLLSLLQLRPFLRVNLERYVKNYYINSFVTKNSHILSNETSSLLQSHNKCCYYSLFK